MDVDPRDWGEGGCGDPGDEDCGSAAAGPPDPFDVAYAEEVNEYYSGLEIAALPALTGQEITKPLVISPRVILKPLTPTAKAVAESLLHGSFVAVVSPEMGERVQIRHNFDFMKDYLKNGEGHSYADAYGYVYIGVMRKNYNRQTDGSICEKVNVYEKENKRFVGTIRNTETIELID